MNRMDDAHGELADGHHYRMSRYLLEISDPEGAVVGTMDVNDMRAVVRQGTTVRITGRTGRVFPFVGASIDDAGQLEAAVRLGLGAAAPAGVSAAPATPAKTETLVKTYTSAKDFEKDARGLSKKGWQVANTMANQPRSGHRAQRRARLRRCDRLQAQVADRRHLHAPKTLTSAGAACGTSAPISVRRRREITPRRALKRDTIKSPDAGRPKPKKLVRPRTLRRSCAGSAGSAVFVECRLTTMWESEVAHAHPVEAHR